MERKHTTVYITQIELKQILSSKLDSENISAFVHTAITNEILRRKALSQRKNPL